LFLAAELEQGKGETYGNAIDEGFALVLETSGWECAWVEATNLTSIKTGGGGDGFSKDWRYGGMEVNHRLYPLIEVNIPEGRARRAEAMAKKATILDWREKGERFKGECAAGGEEVVKGINFE